MLSSISFLLLFLFFFFCIFSHTLTLLHAFNSYFSFFSFLFHLLYRRSSGSDFFFLFFKREKSLKCVLVESLILVGIYRNKPKRLKHTGIDRNFGISFWFANRYEIFRLFRPEWNRINNNEYYYRKTRVLHLKEKKKKEKRLHIFIIFYYLDTPKYRTWARILAFGPKKTTFWIGNDS